MKKMTLYGTTAFSLLLLVLLVTACGGDASNEASTPTTAPATEVTGSGSALLNQLSESLQKNPYDGKLYYSRAKIYYDKEMYDEAIADMAQAMNIDSVNADYHHLLADIFLDYYKSRQALRTMERAAKLFPERIPTLLKLSEFQVILRQNDEAFRTIDQILKLDPQNAEAYFMMGLNFRDVGDDARAINSFQTAVEIDPELTDAWVYLGDLFSKKDNPIALQYYDNAIRLEPENINFLYSKAAYLHSKGELTEAIEMYEDIFKRDPQYADAYYNIGLVYMELDSVAKASNYFDLAIKMDPTYVMAYFYRGLAAEERGELGLAKKNYEQALTLKPDFERASEALARMK